MPETTPQSLLARLRDPLDEAAKLRLVEFCQGYFFHWATHTFHWSLEEAEDLVQDLFVEVLRQIPQFQYDASRRFRGWLFTLARNLAARKRRQRLQAAGAMLDPSEVPAENEVPSLDEREFTAFVLQRAQKIMEADFEPATIRAFQMLVVEEKSGREAAQELGMTPAAVYMAKARVLQRLRDELLGILD